MALNGINSFCDWFPCGAPSEAPTCHAPGFSKSVDNNRVSEMCWRKAGDAFMDGAIVKQVLVDFITHDEHILFDANVPQRLDFIGSVNGACGIAGRIQNEQTCSRGDCFSQHRRGDLEFGRIICFDDDGICARKLNHFRITEPVRGGDDYLIVLFAGSEDNVVTGMFAATGDYDILATCEE